MGLDFIRRTYERWGAEDPFYAVLTSEGRERGGWDPESFYATGRREIAEVMEYLGGLDVELVTGRALDFGCGAGRLTRALADHFDRVVGIDIAAPMVETAREHNVHGDRVEYVVNARDDLSLFPDDHFDLVYSNIVLQHIPPRFVRSYVKEFFRVLRPGGIALFQMRSGPRIEPGSLRDWLYRLNREHLRHLLQRLGGKHPYEIHFLARSQMEELVEECGAVLLDVDDVSRGRGRSFRYCAVAG